MPWHRNDTYNLLGNIGQALAGVGIAKLAFDSVVPTTRTVVVERPSRTVVVERPSRTVLVELGSRTSLEHQLIELELELVDLEDRWMDSSTWDRKSVVEDKIRILKRHLR